MARRISCAMACAIVFAKSSSAALAPCGTPVDAIFANGFGVGPSISAYANEFVLPPPDATIKYLPDEHSSFLPPASSGDPYLFFEAANVAAGTGAIALAVTGIQNNTPLVTYAPGYAAPVLGSPLPFGQCAGAGDPAGTDDEFDENYAAPGSVLQDPTLPAGNLVMIYEGENHCRFDPSTQTYHNVQPYFATAGFARSSDNGVTWPAPTVAPAPGAKRYPIIGGPDAKPDWNSDPTQITAVGNAIPSGYIEGSCLYVVYAAHPAPTDADRRIAIQIARAQLGAADPLVFQKYLRIAGVGAFSSDGLTGAGSDVIPFIAGGTLTATPACTGTQFQPGLSFNETLQRYVMTMVCQVSGMTDQLGWFFSTATSLDAEDWTPPQLIANTQSTSSTCGTGVSFDGWYPSFYSLGMDVGHTGASGVAFYLSGCNTSNARAFQYRRFAVTPDPG